MTTSTTEQSADLTADMDEARTEPDGWQKTDSNRIMEEWGTGSKNGRTTNIRMTKFGGSWKINLITGEDKRRPGTHMTTIGNCGDKEEALKLATEFMEKHQSPSSIDALRFRREYD